VQVPRLGARYRQPAPGALARALKDITSSTESRRTSEEAEMPLWKIRHPVGAYTAAENGAAPLPGAGGSRRAVFVISLICAAQFVLQLDFSVVNVALPSIQRELGMPAAELQWIVTGYALAFGSLLLAGGRLADLLGRRQVLAAGLALFGVASLACGLARWPIMLIIGRIVQGAAGAMVSPAALSLLTTTNAEGAARNRALAIWQATTAAGATAGIVAGGLLTQYFGWRAVFLINPPIIAVMLALVPRLPAGKRSGGGSVDVRGALLVTTGIAALIFGLSSGQQHGFTAPATLIALALAVLLTAGFVVAEKRSAAPMLPLSILAEPARRAAIAAMLLIGAILAGYVYFASLYLQKVLGFSPVATGLALVPSTIIVVLVSTLGTRRLLARFSIKAVLLAGLACMGAGQLWLAQITAGASYPAAVLPGLVLTAAGVGLALPAASIAITSGVQASDQGLAGALFTTSQQTGAAVGLAILATAAAAATDGHGGSLVDGYRLSFLIGAGLAVLAAIIVALQVSSKSHRVEPGHQQAGPGGPPPAPPAPAQLGKKGVRRGDHAGLRGRPDPQVLRRHHPPGRRS
jgi:EmrB/QacA subfamily drug resistance transporter